MIIYLTLICIKKKILFLCLILFIVFSLPKEFSVIEVEKQCVCLCVCTKLCRNITKTLWLLWLSCFRDFVVSICTYITAFCWFFFWKALKLCKEKNISNCVQFWDLPGLCWELFTEDLFLLLGIDSTSFPYCSGHLTH